MHVITEFEYIYFQSSYCYGFWLGSCDILCRFSIYDFWGHHPIHSTILRNMENWKCRWFFFICLFNSFGSQYASDIFLVSFWQQRIIKLAEFRFSDFLKRIWFFFYRFGHPFEATLLVQSFMMIIAMLIMVHICTLVKSRTILAVKTRRFSGK